MLGFSGYLIFGAFFPPVEPVEHYVDSDNRTHYRFGLRQNHKDHSPLRHLVSQSEYLISSDVLTFSFSYGLMQSSGNMVSHCTLPPLLLSQPFKHLGTW